MDPTDRTPRPFARRSGEARDAARGNAGEAVARPDRVGRYAVEAELGRGGMGVVYRARDTRLDRLVALKALPLAMAEGLEARERFEREARLLAALEHPHVAAIFGIEEMDGSSYLVLQFIDGETLAARLLRGALPVAEALDVARQIASGLAAAHRRGIVHCDLKPGNVMVTADGTVKIVDFGIATRVHEVRHDGEDILGTPAYMSPEQIRGEALDPRSDIWSFACLLTECLGGTRPFQGDNPEILLGSVLHREPDLSGLPPDLAPAVRGLVERCLVKDRDHRLQDIEDARLELDLALGAQAGAPQVVQLASLPRALTTFVGRGAELLEVSALLGRAHLVTLTGAAGCGKTRLALEAATRRATDDGVGAWFVPLAPLADAAHVVPAVAATLGLRTESRRTSMDVIVDALRDREGLLVLDNCEHVLAEVSRLATTLLQECPSLVLLCTSREALGIAGELVWRVPSLPHPPARRRVPVDELAGFDAIQLFVARAREVQPAFRLDEETAPSVAAIVERLDGIPLAIELAAARIKILSAKQVLERLADRFRLLTGGSRTAMERHQTLRAALDWSYELLADDEKRCLRELATFAGGFRLEEAARVCTGNEFDVLDLVSRLVDKSLIQTDTDAHEAPRHRLLESVRQHAAIKLEESGDAIDVRRRHRDCYVEYALEVSRHASGSESDRWIHRLEGERDNIRAALEWCLATPDGADAGLLLATALIRYWDVLGIWVEAREWLERVLDRPGVPRGGRAWVRAVTGLGQSAWWLGDLPTADARFAEALDAARAGGHREEAAHARMLQSMCAHTRGDLRGALEGYRSTCTEAREMGELVFLCDSLLNVCTTARDLGDREEAKRSGEEALAIAEGTGERRRIARALRLLGNVARDDGDFERSSTMTERALAIHEARLEKRDIAETRLDLAHVARLRGDIAGARRLYGASGEVSREIGERRGVALALANLGEIARDAGEVEVARANFEESLRYARAIGSRPLVASIVAECAWLIAGDGRHAEAAILLGAVDAARREMGRRLVGAELADYERRLDELRAVLGAEGFDRAWQAGAQDGLDASLEAVLGKDTHPGRATG